MFALISDDLAEETDRRLQRQMRGQPADRHEFLVFFGAAIDPAFGGLARLAFERFPCPVLAVDLRRERSGSWRLHAVRSVPFTRLDVDTRGHCIEALVAHLARRWTSRRRRERYRYDLAILHDPDEPLPPSDRRALGRFVRAGRKLGLDVERVTARDLGRISEFDALFIRETTQVAHHTYRFAAKAQAQDMVVIDDPDSILRCTNKVYLAELLATHRVATPRTVIARRESLLVVEEEIGYPVVLKIPDGSFSRGVVKAESRDELEAHAQTLFGESELILAQEFLYTAYDWRIGVLDRQPLYACRYFMYGKHWQIYNHAKGSDSAGDSETIPIEDAPRPVVRAALRAANLVGDGLYGVDVKQAGRRVVVIEVNDNPSIDAGYEDAILGPELYERIMGSFVRRLDAQMA